VEGGSVSPLLTGGWPTAPEIANMSDIVYRYNPEIDECSYMETSPVYQQAALTQQYCLQFITQDKELLHEFRAATRSGWAEWVSTITPYGDEARKVQAWENDSFAIKREGEYEKTRLADGPLFTSRAAGAQAVRDCVYKVHTYFNPPGHKRKKRRIGLGSLVSSFIELKRTGGTGPTGHFSTGGGSSHIGPDLTEE